VPDPPAREGRECRGAPIVPVPVKSCTWSMHATATCRAVRRGRARQRLAPTRLGGGLLMCEMGGPVRGYTAPSGRGQAVPDPPAREGRQSGVGYPRKVLVRRALLKSGWFPAESFQQMR